MDIKCRLAGLHPDAAVLVATVQALKYNGGVPRTQLRGIVNLGKHIENLQKFGVPIVVAINQFASDTDGEIAFIESYCRERGCDFSLTRVFAEGGRGGEDLAQKVLSALENKPSAYKPLYSLDLGLKEKIQTIARDIYGADGVEYTAAAEKSIRTLTDLGFGSLPVCVAKTQYSLSLRQRRCGLCRCSYRRDHSDARPSQSTGSREN